MALLGSTVAMTAVVAMASALDPSGPPSAAGADQRVVAAARPTRPGPSMPSVAPSSSAPSAKAAPGAPLPTRSGSGKRVVFDMSEQRVWLVGDDGAVRRTYPVSGSRHDNLSPGSYRVYSRARHATSFDLGSTMQYFVRFTRGANAAIGFHDIPVRPSGALVQRVSALGRALSAGCIRQRRVDARALWSFAPTGTRVVVVR